MESSFDNLYLSAKFDEIYKRILNTSSSKFQETSPRAGCYQAVLPDGLTRKAGYEDCESLPQEVDGCQDRDISSSFDDILSSPVGLPSGCTQGTRKTAKRLSPDRPDTYQTAERGNICSSPVETVFSSPVRDSPRRGRSGVEKSPTVVISSSDDSSHEEVHSSPVKQPRGCLPVHKLTIPDAHDQMNRACTDGGTTQNTLKRKTEYPEHQKQATKRSKAATKKQSKKINSHKTSRKSTKCNEQQSKGQSGKSVELQVKHSTSHRSNCSKGDDDGLEEVTESRSSKENVEPAVVADKVPHQKLRKRTGHQKEHPKEDLDPTKQNIGEQPKAATREGKLRRRKSQQEKHVGRRGVNGSGEQDLHRNSPRPILGKRKPSHEKVYSKESGGKNIVCDLEDHRKNNPSSGKKAKPKHRTKRRTVCGYEGLVTRGHGNSQISDNGKERTECHPQNMSLLDGVTKSASSAPESRDTRKKQTTREPLKFLSDVSTRKRMRSGHVENDCKASGIAERVKTSSKRKKSIPHRGDTKQHGIGDVSESSDGNEKRSSGSSIKSSLTMHQRWNILPLSEALKTDTDMPRLHVQSLFGRGGVLDLTKNRVWKSVVDENE